MSDQPECAHCQEPIKGPPATVWQGGPTRYLHHEDGHTDCYHLATVYGHPTPCPRCPGQVWVPFSVRKVLRTWDEFKAQETRP